jgi:hypothetical protein
MSQAAPLKYLCYEPNTRKHILDICTQPEVKAHIEELYKLIDYQMLTMHEQRLQLVAIEHQKAWKQYDAR